MNHEATHGGSIEPARAIRLETLVDYGPGAVVSRTIKKGEAGSLTIFAFDAGQELSEHSAPFDAFVQVLEGEAELIIGKEPVRAMAGETVLMPAHVPHAVRAPGRFKMLLSMIRE